VRATVGTVVLSTVVLAGCAAPAADAGKEAQSACDASFAAAVGTSFAALELATTIRQCGNFAIWEAHAVDHPELLGGLDATTFLHQRCTDPALGLGGYGVCDTLLVAFATPRPLPTRTRAPRRTARPAPVATPRPTPRPAIAGFRSAACSASASIAAAGSTLGRWSDLPAKVQQLNYDAAVARFGYEGETPEEAADNRRIASIRFAQQLNALKRQFRLDAAAANADIARAQRTLHAAPAWTPGARYRTQLLGVARDLATYSSRILRWFDKGTAVDLDRAISGIEGTRLRFGSAVGRAPVGCR